MRRAHWTFPHRFIILVLAGMLTDFHLHSCVLNVHTVMCDILPVSPVC
jgi:hypothetical protein